MRICSKLKGTRKKSEQEKLVHLLRELVAAMSKNSAAKLSDYRIMFDYQKPASVYLFCVVRACVRACTCVLQYDRGIDGKFINIYYTRKSTCTHMHAHIHDIQHT